jgi:hypothetical protein
VSVLWVRLGKKEVNNEIVGCEEILYNWMKQWELNNHHQIKCQPKNTKKE